MGNQRCNMFQFHITVNEGDVEWPEKGMADEGSSAGTGVPSLVITGDSPGPPLYTLRKGESHADNGRNHYLRDWPSTTKGLTGPILEIYNLLKGTDLSRTAHFPGKFL